MYLAINQQVYNIITLTIINNVKKLTKNVRNYELISVACCFFKKNFFAELNDRHCVKITSVVLRDGKKIIRADSVLS